jgi:hypothetical protein
MFELVGRNVASGHAPSCGAGALAVLWCACALCLARRLWHVARRLRRALPPPLGLLIEWKLARLAQPACERLCAPGELEWLAAVLPGAERVSVAAGAVEAATQQHTQSASSEAQIAACSRRRRIAICARGPWATRPLSEGPPRAMSRDASFGRLV